MTLSSTFFLFLLSFLVFFQASSTVKAREGCYIKAIYNFGDSISDTGNLVREEGASASSAHFPYGETTFIKPTGRCSNGLLMIDHLALLLDLPLLDPYLKKDGNFEHGVNFAVAGATSLNSSFFDERGIPRSNTTSSLNVQLEWFKKHLHSVCHSAEDCSQKLERALFMVGEIGGNDYEFSLLAGRNISEVMSYVPLVVRNIINAAKELIDLGAIQLVIPGNFPIGCIPSYLTTFETSDAASYDHKKCFKPLNDFAMFHNSKLQEAMAELRKTFPHVLIMYADYYNSLIQILDNASDLGFDESSLLKACCGSGGKYNYNQNKTCGSPGVPACTNPSRYVSWDGIHMTQAAYKDMAQNLIIGGFAYPSYGVKEKWQCF